MTPFTSVADWTLDTIRDLLSRGGEPGWYDWKEVLKLPKEAYPRLCAMVSGMAITDGGYTVFGVKDKGASPNDRIVGIALNNEEGHHFGQMIDKVRPDIRFVPWTILIEDGRGIFVVHIPQSQRRPHMNQHDCKFYRRGDGGNAKPMEYQEVTDQMLYGEERRRKANLLRVRLVALYYTAQGLVDSPPQHYESNFVRFDIDGLDALFADVSSLIMQPLEMHGIAECFSATRIANRMLDYVIRPAINDYQRKINTVLPSEINTLAYGIQIGAQNAERLLADALQEEPYI